MTPILFKGNATNFNTNGVGALTETLECKVTEERNGVYELEMTVTTTTPNFSEIQTGALIVAKVSDGTRQAFEIDRISKPINQRVTIHANHIGYRASYVPVKPFIANGITETLQGLNDNALTANPFTLYSDFTNETSTYNQSIPKSLRACLGGTEGSLLDTFAGGGAGEFLWDNYKINFLMHRGTDRGTQLRYKKNITEFEQVKETEDFITGVLPYWSNDDGTVVLYGDIQYSPDHTDYDSERVVILDLSDQWEETPTATMINNAGLEYITGTSNNKPSVNITLSFINNTGEEAIPEEIRLCDTVTVYYEPLDVTFKSKVVKTVWNVLKERYDEIEVGDVKSDIRKTIRTAQGDINSLVQTGKKLVSVTQTIDRELGEVRTTVGAVQETAEGAATQVSELRVTVEGIGSSVSDVETKLNNDVYTKTETDSRISQTSTELTAEFTNTITNEVGDVENLVNTMIRLDGNGISIGKQGNRIEGIFDNDSLDFVDTQQSNKKLAWIDANDSLGGNSLSIGDASNSGNRWRIFTRASGSHLTFTRHS